MNDKERQFKGVLDCVKTIMVKEGPLAFWKGFTMCWARVSFFLYFFLARFSLCALARDAYYSQLYCFRACQAPVRDQPSVTCKNSVMLIQLDIMMPGENDTNCYLLPEPIRMREILAGLALLSVTKQEE